MAITPTHCRDEKICLLGSLNNCLQILIDGDGSYNNPFSIVGNLKIGDTLNCTPNGLEVCIDPASSNQLKRSTNGCLYVAPPKFVEPNACEAPMGCIDVKVLGGGCEDDPFRIIAEPIINPLCELIECTPQGLCVHPPEISVISNNCIDLCLTGSGIPSEPWVLESSIILNPSASNLIQCTQQGLYSHVFIEGFETDTAYTLVSGVGTQSDPYKVCTNIKIDPTSGNILSNTLNGLRVQGARKYAISQSVISNTEFDIVHGMNLPPGQEFAVMVQAYDGLTGNEVSLKINTYLTNSLKVESPVNTTDMKIVVIG